MDYRSYKFVLFYSLYTVICGQWWQAKWLTSSCSKLVYLFIRCQERYAFRSITEAEKHAVCFWSWIFIYSKYFSLYSILNTVMDTSLCKIQLTCTLWLWLWKRLEETYADMRKTCKLNTQTLCWLTWDFNPDFRYLLCQHPTLLSNTNPNWVKVMG